MREIKFRGRRADNGEWIYGSFVNMHATRGGWTAGIQIKCGTFSWVSINVDPETVGQFTGLLDSNGVEIYEGDVLRVTYDTNYSGLPLYFGEVKYGEDQGYPAFDLDPWIDCEMNALSWLKSESDPSVIKYEVVASVGERV